MKRRYLDTLLVGLRTRGSSESAIMIFGRVLACAGSGVNKVTDDFLLFLTGSVSRGMSAM